MPHAFIPRADDNVSPVEILINAMTNFSLGCDSVSAGSSQNLGMPEYCALLQSEFGISMHCQHKHFEFLREFTTFFDRGDLNHLLVGSGTGSRIGVSRQ